MHRPALALAALVWLAGCDASDPSDTFVSPLLGVYTGTRTVTDEDRSDVEDVTFTVAADEDARTISFTLRPESGGPERIDGTYDESGVTVDVAQDGVSFRFTVDPGGDIDGTYSAFDQPGDVSGVLTPSRFDLTFTPGAAAGETGTATTEIRTSR